MAASPFQWGHQIAWLISFLAMPVLVGATVLLLVVLPALDTLSAGQVLPFIPSKLLCISHVAVDQGAWHLKSCNAPARFRISAMLVPKLVL